MKFFKKIWKNILNLIKGVRDLPVHDEDAEVKAPIIKDTKVPIKKKVITDKPEPIKTKPVIIKKAKPNKP